MARRIASAPWVRRLIAEVTDSTCTAINRRLSQGRRQPCQGRAGSPTTSLYIGHGHRVDHPPQVSRASGRLLLASWRVRSLKGLRWPADNTRPVSNAGGTVNEHHRLEQLQEMVSRLERMPSSTERDWMLAEVRARAVDVDTDVRPAALRALPTEEARGDDAARFATSKPARRAPVHRWAPRYTRPSPSPTTLPMPAVSTAVREYAINLLVDGEVLCLDESSVTPRVGRPWAAGLRG